MSLGRSHSKDCEANDLTEAEHAVIDTLNVELIPGTEILRDLPGTHFAHGKGKSHVVLVPQPHNDIHDPLNWSPMWKYTTIGVMTFFNFLGNWNTLSIAPLTSVFIAEWNLTITQVALLTGVCILSLGYANLLLVPCQNIFGRRPVSIGCSIIIVGASLWAAAATSYGSMMGARVLIGLAGAYSESTMPMVIADVMFVHERGLWMGVYFTVFFAGAFIGPIVSGTIAQQVSWRWYFWISAILQGVCTVLLIVFLPETYYHRGSTLEEMVNAQSRPVATNSTEPELVNNAALSGGETPPVGLVKHEPITDTNSTGVEDLLGNGYPSRQQRWAVLVKPHKHEASPKMIFRHVISPFKIVFYPVILYSSLCVAFPACALIVNTLLYSQLFGGPPYNFSLSAIGYVNFALLGGAIIALLIAGPFSDWLSMKLTIRNDGIREPEMRLWSLIPWLIVGIIGMTISGVGQDHLWDWRVTIIVGYSCIAMHVVAIPVVGVTYAIDSYKPAAGQIMTVATVIKNSFAYGMTHFINTWAAEKGAVPPYLTLMALSVGIPLLGMPLFLSFGKRLRRWTRHSVVHSFNN